MKELKRITKFNITKRSLKLLADLKDSFIAKLNKLILEDKKSQRNSFLRTDKNAKEKSINLKE